MGKMIKDYTKYIEVCSYDKLSGTAFLVKHYKNKDAEDRFFFYFFLENSFEKNLELGLMDRAYYISPKT